MRGVAAREPGRGHHIVVEEEHDVSGGDLHPAPPGIDTTRVLDEHGPEPGIVTRDRVEELERAVAAPVDHHDDLGRLGVRERRPRTRPAASFRPLVATTTDTRGSSAMVGTSRSANRIGVDRRAGRVATRSGPRPSRGPRAGPAAQGGGADAASHRNRARLRRDRPRRGSHGDGFAPSPRRPARTERTRAAPERDGAPPRAHVAAIRHRGRGPSRWGVAPPHLRSLDLRRLPGLRAPPRRRARHRSGSARARARSRSTCRARQCRAQGST